MIIYNFVIDLGYRIKDYEEALEAGLGSAAAARPLLVTPSFFFKIFL